MKKRRIGIGVSCLLWLVAVAVQATAGTTSAKRVIEIIAVAPPESAPSWPAQRIFVALSESPQSSQLELRLSAEGWPARDRWPRRPDAVVVCLPPTRPQGAVISDQQLADIQAARAHGAGVVVLGYGAEWPEFNWIAPQAVAKVGAVRTSDAPHVRQPASRGGEIFRGIDDASLEAESTGTLEGPSFEGLLYAQPAKGGRAAWGAWVDDSEAGGRAFGTAWIENDASWQRPGHRRFILNGILWAAGAELPPRGVESVYHGYDATLQQLDRLLGRDNLPEYQVIPAARTTELSPARPESTDTSRFTTWTVSHGDAGSRRYSALAQINRENVAQLEQAWIYRSKDGPAHIQSNPIVVDGVMYGPTAGRAMVALDAATGRERWRFQLEAVATPRLEDSPARRGLVYWPGEGAHAPRLLFTSGNWVYALDPATGRPMPEFGENGRVALPTGGTAAGVLCGGVIAFGGLYGDIFGYDPATGALRWRFHTLPQEGELHADSWIGPDKRGAHCWGGLAADQARGIIYAAVGNPHPLFVGVGRAGNNLYSNCLVAIDARTGHRLWHFQNIRHDIWDLDNPAPPNLLTLERDGRQVDVVACVTKSGSTLLLDRVSGQPVFPFRLRRAPRSSIPGEFTAPYQPDPLLPEPFSSMEVTPEDVTDRSPGEREHVLRQSQGALYGWHTPPAVGRTLLFRSSRGGAEWGGAAVDVPTGRIFLTSNRIISKTTVLPSDEREPDPSLPPTEGQKVYGLFCAACHGPARRGQGMMPSLMGLRHRMTDQEVDKLLTTGRGQMPPMPVPAAQRKALIDFLMRRDQVPAAPKSEVAPEYIAVLDFLRDSEGYPGSKSPWGELICLDLNSGRIDWRIPLGGYEALTKQGITGTGAENFGGATVTAGGLVFVGGTPDRTIRAFDRDTGRELWSAPLPWGGYAPPTVYEADGRQFVVIAATGGGKLGTETGDAYVAFALPRPNP